jgi:tetratricopeptide (TPR) repeat protein
MDVSEKAKQLFIEGLGCLKLNNFKDSENKFLESLKLVPNRLSVLNNLAAVQITLGKHTEANELAEKTLKLYPENAVSFYNLGLIKQDQNLFDESLSFFNKAIKIDPNYAEPINASAVSLTHLKRYDEALAKFDQAIKFKKDGFDIIFNKANLFKILKRFDESIECYDQAVKINPNYKNAWLMKGDVLNDLKRYEESLVCYDAAIILNDDFFEAFCNKGLTLYRLKRYPEALTVCDQALKINPKCIEALNIKGLCKMATKDFDEAINFFDKVLEVDPNYADGLNNKGLSLKNLKRVEEAVIYLDKACSFLASEEYLVNKGAALALLGKFDEALLLYNQALEMKPDFFLGWSNKGLLLHQMAHRENNYNEALECYDKAISINPDSPIAYWNKGLTQLTLGQFEEGWKNYEYRFSVEENKPQFTEVKRLKSLKELKNFTRILIWSEQGIGDTIQFSRYAIKICELGANVTLEVQKPLVKLYKQFGCKITVRGEPLVATDYDFQVPLLNLPLLFEANINNIPFDHSYIKTSPIKDNEWKYKMESSKKLNIGIACSGNPEYLGDRERSTNLKYFHPLLEKANLFLLQKEVRKEDEDFLKKHPEINFIGQNIDDFDDLASVIQNMDLIVSTDTSIPHLAGALGKPVYILLPSRADWRWFLNTNTSPWYSSATLFRKFNQESWESIMNKVIMKLPNK